MRRSVAWFITAYFICALAGWCNVCPVLVDPDLIFYIKGLYAANAKKWQDVDWGNLDQVALKLVPFGDLQRFAALSQAVGAVFCGVLFDLVGARACYILSAIAAVAHYSVRYTAVSMRTLYLSKLMMLLQHSYLVTRALVIQEASEETRTRALVHTELAYAIGAALGVRSGRTAAAQMKIWAVAIAPGVLSALALPLTLLLTREPAIERGESTPKLKATQSGSLLPTPATALGLAAGREGLKGLITQPVLALLVVAKVVDVLAEGLQARMLRHMEILQYSATVEQTVVLTRLVAMLLLVGPFTRRLTPRTFLLLCMSFQAAVSFGVAAAFSSLNPLAGLLQKSTKGSLLHAAIGGHHLASSASGTLLTTLLASAVVREERGTVLGLDTGLYLMPPVASLVLSVLLCDRGGMSGVFGMSFVLYFGIWLAMRHLILPRYREKDN